MQKTLKKIFNIVEKTGDRVIVLDSQTDQAFVVMSLSDYEELLNELPRKAPHKGQKELTKEVGVWQKAHQDLVDQSLQPEKLILKPEKLSSESEVIVQLNRDEQVEPEKTGNKYYFEEVETEEGCL